MCINSLMLDRFWNQIKNWIIIKANYTLCTTVPSGVIVIHYGLVPSSFPLQLEGRYLFSSATQGSLLHSFLHYLDIKNTFLVKPKWYFAGDLLSPSNKIREGPWIDNEWQRPFSRLCVLFQLVPLYLLAGSSHSVLVVMKSRTATATCFLLLPTPIRASST